MCDSVGFIQPCHWTGDSDLGGLCPVTESYSRLGQINNQFIDHGNVNEPQTLYVC